MSGSTHTPAKAEAGTASAAVQTWAAAWPLSDHTVTVVLSAAAGAPETSLPVVIYLPGLGQTSDAGELWRARWASAGYAVVSVQPLADDANAWASELARAGEFRALGEQRYGADAMERRLRALGEVVAQGRARTAAGEVAWRAVDWQRVALAGYDLGAYAAMVAAGERGRDTGQVGVVLPVRAVLALSPYAHPGAADADRRYEAIRAAVLSVTSDVDNDVLGRWRGVAERRVPFEHLSGAVNDLLTLQGLPHAGLSGDLRDLTPARERVAVLRARDGTGAGDDAPSQRSRNGRSRVQSSGADDRSVEVAGGVGLLAVTQARERVALAQDLSVRFLDAYVREDAGARHWLGAEVAGWLGARGTWVRAARAPAGAAAR